jgi:hypothetical protein
MSLSLRDIRGEKNPNWRGGGLHICVGCGGEFSSHLKSRKYCSHACYIKHRTITPELSKAYRTAGNKSAALRALNPRPVLGRRRICKACGVSFRHENRRAYCDDHQHIAKAVGLEKAQSVVKPKLGHLWACEHCGAGFYRTAKSIRKFCSYECHLASGGAIRAGLAAVRATMVYGAKKDANHKEIVDAITKCGVPFIDMSALGCGVPDLLVEAQGRLQLWEIKNRKTSYGRKGLNKNQKAWAESWRGSPVRIINSVDDALEAIGAKH